MFTSLFEQIEQVKLRVEAGADVDGTKTKSVCESTKFIHQPSERLVLRASVCKPGCLNRRKFRFLSLKEEIRDIMDARKYLVIGRRSRFFVTRQIFCVKISNYFISFIM